MVVFIAICDDDKRISAQLENALIRIFDKLTLQYEIDVYHTGEALCKSIGDGAHYDLIFLDIEFPAEPKNGVEYGKLIRDVYNKNLASIVYISWEMKYSMQLFEIRPLHFLIKPLKYEEIETVTKTYLKISGLWASDFTYRSGHDSFKVQIKDIVYLESSGRKLTLHLVGDRKEEFYGSLKTVYREQLHKFDFLFIHASYVVNYDYIAALKYDELFLVNQTNPLPISQGKRIEVREAYYAILERRKV